MSLRLAFLIPSMSSGGMERAMCQIINYIVDKKNDEVHLVLYGKSSNIFYSISPKVIIHHHNFKYSDRYRKIYTIKTIYWLRKEIKLINPHSILSFGEIWNNLVMIALYGLDYPIYLSDRCKPDMSFSKFHTILRKKLYPKSTGIIAQTQKAKEIYLTQYKHENIIVIGNPIRNITSCSIKKENIVISVGRLIKTKNFDQLIDIFANINTDDWKLIIIGGDSLKQNNSVLLQKKIEDMGMQNKIILAGTQKEIEPYLLKSRIFAFTSSSEGFPNVIGEAMSAGLPVVAYNCIAGPSEMICDNRNGFLVPLFDTETFSNRLKYLMENTSQASIMGDLAKHDIQKFSIDIIGELYYKEITSKVITNKNNRI